MVGDLPYMACRPRLMISTKVIRQRNGAYMKKTDSSKRPGLKPRESSSRIYLGLVIVSVLVPFVGIIMGAIYMAKDKIVERKLGKILVACGVLSLILGGVAWHLLYPDSTPTSRTLITTSPVTQSAQQVPAWDIEAKYALISAGMTKTQVREALGRAPASCSQVEQSGAPETYYSCTYKGSKSDEGIIIISYVNDVVVTKKKVTN